MIPKLSTVVIENLTPLVDGGRHPLKRIVGDDLVVEADVFKDGHDLVSALLKWRKQGDVAWNETPMTPLVNDRWHAVCSLFENTTYEYTIEAWGDPFRSWQQEFRKKFEAGVTPLTSETLEGAAIVRAAAQRALLPADKRRLEEIAALIETSEPAQVDATAHWSELEALMIAWADRTFSTEYLPYPQVIVDRERAGFAAWYEFFPRSAEGFPDKGSTFRSCLGRVDDAKAMGFDVVYFPPIHPIGTTHRKGKNNSVICEPDDPGVPYAIGNRHQKCPNGGGHRDVAPELGTLKDFDWLVAQIHQRGMEVALDFALNCSPDHPWVHDHPEWFFKRPDGTMKYAENPPKKYEDVYPLDYQNPNWRELWEELTQVILFWCGHGVKIFRVDNPHTKPVAFWQYLIGKVRATHPDAIFLSEAFTRPKMMKALAKSGFTQSYTYFTWRGNKYELSEYFTELTQTAMAEYFRGNLFTNTPDILPYFLQQGGRPAFMIRAALAATLSPLYGVYSGFELCENAAVPGKEEYLDSEKYQFKGRDWNAPGNIKEFLTRLNRIRRENRALQEYANLRFFHAENDNVLFYGKMTESRDNIILVVVNLDPWNRQDAYIQVPVEAFGWMETDTYQVHDLLWDERYLWHGGRNFVALDPHAKPVHILRVRRWMSREQDFDYYF
ncbi:MAG: alpha-1,4-glucan--maltose-1-phosphate maltosyltransferase [Chthoniobacteraceae bacterium]|nr:alpha-1,4-glucan--maltose-1-phosphate maltosyltransferase [Chthoniobacteraceae bacterium]